MLNLNYDFFIHGISLVLFGLMVGNTHRKRGVRDRVGFWLGAYLLISFLVEVNLIFVSQNQTSVLPILGFTRLYLYGIILGVGFILQLSGAFLIKKDILGWLLFAGLGLLSVIGLDQNWFSMAKIVMSQYPTLGDIQVALDYGSWLLWGILCLAILGYTLAAFRNETQRLRRNRIIFWTAGLVLILGGNALVLTNQNAFGSLLAALGAVVISIFVLNPRLPNLGAAIPKIVSTLLTTLIEIGLYLGGFVGLQLLFSDYGRYSPFHIGLGLALIVIVLFNPILRVLNKWIQRLFVGERQDYGQIFREYSQNISNILDVKLLSQVVVDLVGDLIGIESGTVFTVDSEMGEDAQRRYRILAIHETDGEENIPGLLPIDGALSTSFSDDRIPLTISEVEMLPRFSKVTGGERLWLTRQNMDVFVPIHAKDEWIGLLALGPKVNGTSYSASDLNLLETIADQTAVALQNARLVESLVRINNEFRRAYSAMEDAHTKLERIDQTKSDFISISSHELRTPLTVLSGYSQMLMEDPQLKENEYYRKVIGGIYEGTTRLHEIVDSMLEVAKIDSRGLQLKSQTVNLASAIKQVGNNFSKTFEERKQTLVIDLSDDLPRVVGDPDALGKVFFHLLSNAIKYTPDGGKISVTGEFEREDSYVDHPVGKVQIKITDTGIGIDPRYKELIFTKESIHNKG